MDEVQERENGRELMESGRGVRSVRRKRWKENSLMESEEEREGAKRNEDEEVICELL
jgi:hypothetical protein